MKNDNVIKNDLALSNQQVPAELYEIENEETGIKMRFKKVKKKKDLSRQGPDCPGKDRSPSSNLSVEHMKDLVILVTIA